MKLKFFKYFNYEKFSYDIYSVCVGFDIYISFIISKFKLKVIS